MITVSLSVFSTRLPPRLLANGWVRSGDSRGMSWAMCKIAAEFLGGLELRSVDQPTLMQAFDRRLRFVDGDLALRAIRTVHDTLAKDLMLSRKRILIAVARRNQACPASVSTSTAA